MEGKSLHRSTWRQFVAFLYFVTRCFSKWEVILKSYSKIRRRSQFSFSSRGGSSGLSLELSLVVEYHVSHA